METTKRASATAAVEADSSRNAGLALVNRAERTENLGKSFIQPPAGRSPSVDLAGKTDEVTVCSASGPDIRTRGRQCQRQSCGCVVFDEALLQEQFLAAWSANENYRTVDGADRFA